MPRIFDNITEDLLATLRKTLQVSERAHFCVGYLNLRGWQAIDDLVQPWIPDKGQICRVLIGMQRPPHDEIRDLYRTATEQGGLDNASALRLKMQFAAHLREQITLGIPTGADEKGLRKLAKQLLAGQVVVKLFLPYPHGEFGFVSHYQTGLIMTNKSKFTVRIGQEQLDHDLTREQLLRQFAQPFFIGAGRNAQRDLLTQMRCELHLEAQCGRIVETTLFGGGAVQISYLVVRWPLHADQDAANLAFVGNPWLNKIVNGLPAPEIEIADTKMRALGDLKSLAQGGKQVFSDVVEDARHCGVELLLRPKTICSASYRRFWQHLLFC